MAVATLGWGLGYWKTALNAERQMQLLLLLASVLPAKTFGQHLRKKGKNKNCSAKKVGFPPPNWVKSCGKPGGNGMEAKTAQLHRAYKSTRSETLAPAQGAHVLHLLDGDLHALGSHQQQIAAGCSQPACLPFFLLSTSPRPNPCCSFFIVPLSYLWSEPLKQYDREMNARGGGGIPHPNPLQICC